MKALSILSPSVAEKIDDNDKYILEIDSLKIPLALIDIPDTEYDENDDKHANTVLVKKKGFSLNYRDLGVIEHAWNRLKNIEHDTYYPIGSEFCGEILKIGKNVDNLNVGDYVIANCSYPLASHNALPGIPSNHGSKELEIFHKGKLIKISKNIPIEQASGMSIGVQTSMSMIRKAEIKEDDNVLVTSITSNTSLVILNFLKEKKCNIYGLSYSGKNQERMKELFPFIKEIFSFKENNIPTDLLFDVVLDPFADTYLVGLQSNLNFEARYVTCGMFNQSSEKIRNESSYINLPSLLGALIGKNIKLIANCLGTSEDLENGIKILNNNVDSNILIDTFYSLDKDIKLFLGKSFSKINKIGKVAFLYS